MTDVFSPEKRSAVMRRVKGKDTAPELKVRRLLRRMGVGYRLHRADLPGKPDIAMPGRKLAIFVHGCFWHGHDCKAGKLPSSRSDYWIPKIKANRERDERALNNLEALGWHGLVVWQCETKDCEALLHKVETFLHPTASGAARRA
jgi:DNA mismatch endonuclease (patch repair protein)